MLEVFWRDSRRPWRFLILPPETRKLAHLYEKYGIGGDQTKELDAGEPSGGCLEFEPVDLVDFWDASQWQDHQELWKRLAANLPLPWRKRLGHFFEAYVKGKEPDSSMISRKSTSAALRFPIYICSMEFSSTRR